MRLPLDSGPDNFLTALTKLLNSPRTASCPLTPNSEKILFAFTTD